MEIRDWLLTIAMIGNFTQWIWGYIERHNDKTSERIGELAEKCDALERDLSALQAVSASAPSHADLSKIYESVNRLAETVNRLVGENEGQSAALRLIQNYFMEKAAAR